MSDLSNVKSIYIAGKMSGIECFNFERFFYHAHRLKLEGFEVFNPAQIDCEKMLDGWQYTADQYEAVLAHDLEIIRTQVDAVYMLRGWEDSPGATRERALALELGKPVVYEL